MKYKITRIIAAIVADVAVAGLLLVVFAFFHHVLPAIQSRSLVDIAPAVSADSVDTPSDTDISAPEEDVVVSDEPVAEPEAVLMDTPADEQIEQEPEEIVDNRTEWQKKFEEHFSDEIIMTENSYKSPNVSIEIETIQEDFGHGLVTYHVADIYIGSMENFTTYTANDRMLYCDNQNAMEMHEASNAILSMTGDFLTYQQTGFLIRNGEVYRNDFAYCDICVLYPDGTMETYLKHSYTNEEIMEREPLHVWNFGPVLLDENGAAKTAFNTSSTVSQINPRSALGYYEPGHYCFVVVDGRQNGYSIGMLLGELSQLFERLGCKAAYNLDGGGSALMMFNDAHYSRMSNGGDRKLGDILVIRETEGVQ